MAELLWLRDSIVVRSTTASLCWSGGVLYFLPTTTPGDDTTPPVIGNLAYDRAKISDEPGFTRCTVTFIANEDIQAWEVRKGGAGPGQGTLVESGGAVAAGTLITAYVDYDELETDGSYEINVYAQDVAGNWTPYRQA
jgi:hypothetical protein